MFGKSYLFVCIFSFSLLLVFISNSSSADPLDNWHLRYSLPQGTTRLLSVTYGNGEFLATGDGLGDGSFTSPDGLTWSKSGDIGWPVTYVWAVTYADNIFMAVGYQVSTSPDGVTWTPRTSGGWTYRLTGVTYGNGIFVVVGTEGAVLTSSDGISWTVKFVPLGSWGSFQGVAYGNGTFVAVGSTRDWANGDLLGPSSTIFASRDGSTWTLAHSGHPYDYLINAVTYGNGTFVAVGSDGTILTSADGKSWKVIHLSIKFGLGGVTYGNGTFVAVGSDVVPKYVDGHGPSYDGVILTSTDGVNWKQRNPGIAYPLLGVIYGNNTFVVVGEGDTILQSDPLPSILSVPTTQNIYQYTPAVSPLTSINPEMAKPIGVGSIATGGDTLSIDVALSKFSGPVDVYFVIQAPSIDPTNFYILKSDYSLQPLSMVFEPWKGNTKVEIDETIFANIPISWLPSGTYYLYLAATPAFSLDTYYIWTTYFVVP
jgi:hypothetical protein